MNESASSAEKKATEGGPEPASSTPKVAANLSANLCADYEALQNDMQQAQELAADFQRQLAGKSNEVAQLKQLFEKTTQDLEQLQAGIVALRAERHRLANEAMMAAAFELKLTKASEERDRLRLELAVARELILKNDAEIARLTRERDATPGSLAKEVESLRRQLAEAQSRPQGSRGTSASVEEEFIDISFGT